MLNGKIYETRYYALVNKRINIFNNMLSQLFDYTSRVVIRSLRLNFSNYEAVDGRVLRTRLRPIF